MSDQPPFDPSANVLQLVEAAIQRIDDLMAALEKRVIEKIDINNAHGRELRAAESARIDTILNLIQKGTEDDIKAAVNRAEALALQLVEYAHRISALELAQSQNQGKSSWTTPIIAAIFSFITGTLAYIAAKYLK